MIEGKSIKERLGKLGNEIHSGVTLVAVSKTKPQSDIVEAFEAGHLDFGENKAQEMVEKYESLSKDIKWHMIGHLQRNKVKYIAPFVHLIHSVDSLRLLKEINKQGKNSNRVINCLLQIHIADEETKFGLSEQELIEILTSEDFKQMENVKIVGLMGMATNTDDTEIVRSEFLGLKKLFDQIKSDHGSSKIEMNTLSMGMSGDYTIALECGSNMIRIGSTIFGARNYNN